MELLPTICRHQPAETRFDPERELRLVFTSGAKQSGDWVCGWWALTNMVTFYRFGEFEADEPDGSAGAVYLPWFDSVS